jgi:uncharacterized membrane protein (UPF0127 family)
MRYTAIGAVVLAAACASGVGAQYAARRAEVVFPDKTRVSAEIAHTDEERQRGLMFRKSMGATEGMIFIFPQAGIYPFWMKNTLISLDMLWVDRSGRVVWIAEHVPPCQADPCPDYPPRAEATYVVEVNAGFAKKHGVKVGDTLQLLNLPKH